MELLIALAACLMLGFGGRWLASDPAVRGRLAVWLWPPAVAWALVVGWVWAVQGVEERHEWWALAGVDLGAVVVGLATLGALARAVTVRTGWYVVPYCLLTFAGAAYTWLLGTMYIRDAWF